ncbi:MAG: N-(5'-phosphoribosyl)anthranilate isomerase, partial [Planktomarina sp.]|nr:N-(5'-phosphoribosyl)anthranilate isomerase [Planktomarina sp.]
VRRSAARQVDVSSGIETAPGQKSAELMAKFVSEANR